MSTYDLKSYEGGLKYSNHFRNKMAQWVVQELQIKSIVELGCGPGYFLEAYAGWVKFWNMPFMGFDGCDVPDEALRIGRYNFKCLDLSAQGLSLRTHLVPEFKSNVDCLMSLEMLEHWDPALDYRFFKLVRDLSPTWVILSVARPGQAPMPGESHPNCQEVDEVIHKMARINYAMDTDKSDELRRIMMAPSYLLIDRPWADFYQRNTRVYRKVP